MKIAYSFSPRRGVKNFKETYNYTLALIFKYNTWCEKILNLKREIKSDPEVAHLFHSFLHKKSLYVRIFTLSILQKEFYHKFSRKKKLFLVVLPLNRTRKFSWSRGERERKSNVTTITASDWLPAPSPSMDGGRTFEHSKVMCLLNFHHELFFPQLPLPFENLNLKLI